MMKKTLTTPAEEPTDELREITRLYDRFLQDFHDRVRQLHRLLDLCFPEFTSLLTSIRGMGALSAARIVVAVGDPARFRHAGAFAAYVGAVPGTNRSGLRRPGHSNLCPLGNARLRRALYMTTLAVVRHNPWLGA
jgi:transposase